MEEGFCEICYKSYNTYIQDSEHLEIFTNERQSIEDILMPNQIEINYLYIIGRAQINISDRLVEIDKIFDDWFLVHDRPLYYKCDQIYGLIELFKEIFNIPN